MQLLPNVIKIAVAFVCSFFYSNSPPPAIVEVPGTTSPEPTAVVEEIPATTLPTIVESKNFVLNEIPATTLPETSKQYNIRENVIDDLTSVWCEKFFYYQPATESKYTFTKERGTYHPTGQRYTGARITQPSGKGDYFYCFESSKFCKSITDYENGYIIVHEDETEVYPEAGYKKRPKKIFVIKLHYDVEGNKVISISVYPLQKTTVGEFSDTEYDKKILEQYFSKRQDLTKGVKPEVIYDKEPFDTSVLDSGDLTGGPETAVEIFGNKQRIRLLQRHLGKDSSILPVKSEQANVHDIIVEGLAKIGFELVTTKNKKDLLKPSQVYSRIDHSCFYQFSPGNTKTNTITVQSYWNNRYWTDVIFEPHMNHKVNSAWISTYHGYLYILLAVKKENKNKVLERLGLFAIIFKENTYELYPMMMNNSKDKNENDKLAENKIVYPEGSLKDDPILEFLVNAFATDNIKLRNYDEPFQNMRGYVGIRE